MRITRARLGPQIVLAVLVVALLWRFNFALILLSAMLFNYLAIAAVVIYTRASEARHRGTSSKNASAGYSRGARSAYVVTTTHLTLLDELSAWLAYVPGQAEFLNDFSRARTRAPEESR